MVKRTARNYIQNGTSLESAAKEDLIAKFENLTESVGYPAQLLQNLTLLDVIHDEVQ